MIQGCQKAENYSAGTSSCVLLQLCVLDGDQNIIVITYMTRDQFELFITTSICIAQAVGHYNCKIMSDNDHGHVFYVKVFSPKDVARFHAHSWAWRNEYVMFCRIKKLVISEVYSHLLEAGRACMWF